MVNPGQVPINDGKKRPSRAIPACTSLHRIKRAWAAQSQPQEIPLPGVSREMGDCCASRPT
jgi:hypothetical protein